MPPHTLDTIQFTDKNETLHRKWKEIKSRYTEVLTANNVRFNRGLGRMLDKRATQWKKIEAWSDRKLPDLALVTAIGKAKVKSELTTLTQNGTSLEAAARAYLVSIANVGNPAQRALTEALNEIVSYAESDQTIGRSLLNSLAR